MRDSPAAPIEEHRDVAVLGVAHQEVAVAVIVEIGDGEGFRSLADGEGAVVFPAVASNEHRSPSYWLPTVPPAPEEREIATAGRPPTAIYRMASAVGPSPVGKRLFACRKSSPPALGIGHRGA